MAAILKKRYTSKDATVEIVEAILTVAEDKHGRVLLSEHCEWLETKLREVARLAHVLKKQCGGRRIRRTRK